MLIVVSSHITTSCRDSLGEWAKNNPKIRLPPPWERKEIENEILKSSDATKLAISFGLLPSLVTDLLPPNPEKLRTGVDDIGLAMEYRYWLTEEEVKRIGYVVDLLSRLESYIVDECGPHKYFEDVCLAIPNWSTFLTLLQSQLKLEIAIRNYLFALNSNFPANDINSFAQKINVCVESVKQAGDASYYVD